MVDNKNNKEDQSPSKSACQKIKKEEFVNHFVASKGFVDDISTEKQFNKDANRNSTAQLPKTR